jgi:hypothetical protein
MCKSKYNEIDAIQEPIKIKVDKLCIVADITNQKKPYYLLLYREIGSNEEHLGYGSYNLTYVLIWKEQYFEIVNNS